MTNLENPITQFTTNSFVGNPVRTIMESVFAGMGLMFISFMLTPNAFISMAFLFAGILLVYGYKLGKVQYSLYPFGIHQTIRRFIPDMLGRPPEARLITWDLIKSYKIDEELSRSLKPYTYIKLFLVVSPGEIWITDQIDKDGFDKFRAAFEQIMDKSAPGKWENEVNTINRSLGMEESKPYHIKKKKSFYATPRAKLITLFFVVVCLGFLIMGLEGSLKTTYWVRLGIIIVPGTAYMVYRTFFRKNT